MPYADVDRIIDSKNPNRFFPIKKKVADWPDRSLYYRVELFDYAHSGTYDECYATRAGFIKGLRACAERRRRL